MSAQQFLRSRTDSIIGNTSNTPQERMYCGVLGDRNKHAPQTAFSVIFSLSLIAIYIAIDSFEGHFLRIMSNER